MIIYAQVFISMIVIYQVKVREFVEKKSFSFLWKFSLKALQAFLHGLVKNTTCKTLELKVDDGQTAF
jgi:hypothetical protein